MIYLTSLLFVTTKTFPKEQSWQSSALPKLTSIAELYEVTQYSGALLSKIYFQHTQFWLLTNQERHGNMNWKSLWTKCFFFQNNAVTLLAPIKEKNLDDLLAVWLLRSR